MVSKNVCRPCRSSRTTWCLLTITGLQLLQHLLLKLPRRSCWCSCCMWRPPKSDSWCLCTLVWRLCLLSHVGCWSKQGRLELISWQSGIEVVSVIIIRWGLQACPRALRYPFERLLGHTLSGKVTWMLPLGKGKGMMVSRSCRATLSDFGQLIWCWWSSSSGLRRARTK